MQFEVANPNNPPTYIMQNSYQIGVEAMKLMQQALNGADIANAKIVIPANMVFGHSRTTHIS
jgi:DNA-binding LacI/PurR family transcriptional regulator